jgi:predicted AlkP superfamily pyrophosphatase or phosphodiesterase
VEKAAFQEEFCRPLYEDYCFSQIPATVRRLLGLGKGGLPIDCTGKGTYDKVVVLLIDCFGWRFFEKYVDRYPFLKQFLTDGIASKITSQFPSTTAAHITTLASDLEVGESGVFEWFYFEPKLDRVIAPLLFSYAGDKQVGTLAASGIDPQELYPKNAFYASLNIPVFVYQPSVISHSPYSKILFRGTTACPYQNIATGIREMNERIKAEPKGCFYLYYGDVDAAAHRHGVHSKEVDKAVHQCLTALQDILEKSPNTAYIMIADHGMIDIDPQTTIYLNQEIPNLTSLLRHNKQGEVIAPAGSCRDFFVYAEKIDEAKELLDKHLAGKAAVFKTEDLIQDHFFGLRKPSPEFLSRVGNLVILPRGNNSVWWYEKGRFEQHFHAMHGGLSREEMETIFLFTSS